MIKRLLKHQGCIETIESQHWFKNICRLFTGATIVSGDVLRFRPKINQSIQNIQSQVPQNGWFHHVSPIPVLSSGLIPLMVNSREPMSREVPRSHAHADLTNVPGDEEGWISTWHFLAQQFMSEKNSKDMHQ